MHLLQKAGCMYVCIQVQQVTTGVRNHNSFACSRHDQQLRNMFSANHTAESSQFPAKMFFPYTGGLPDNQLTPTSESDLQLTSTFVLILYEVEPRHLVAV